MNAKMPPTSLAQRRLTHAPSPYSAGDCPADAAPPAPVLQRFNAEVTAVGKGKQAPISVTPAQRWYVDYPEMASRARLHLICVPYAGGGASVFRQWQTALGSEVHVCRVQLPGREERAMEPPRTNLLALARECADALLPLIGNKPYAFYGHSMGTRVVFELARELRRRTGRNPEHLFVAACNAPHLPEPAPAHRLPDAAFAAAIASLGGTPQEVLENPDLMHFFLPLLRADYTLKETYRYYADVPFTGRITALYGLQDSETSAEGMAAWRRHAAAFSQFSFNGGHFFLKSHQQDLLRLIRNSLSAN